MKDLGKQVRTLRQAQGLSQAQLARKAGVGQASLSKIESGAVKNLTVKTLIRIADAMAVSLDVLVRRTSERLIRAPDFVLTSEIPLDEKNLHRKLQGALAGQHLRNQYVIVEQRREGDQYVTSIEVRQLKSGRRLSQDTVRTNLLAERVVEEALADPRLGCQRRSYQLLKKGVRLSRGTAQNVLVAEGLGTRRERAQRLREQARKEKLVLTKKQQEAIDRILGPENEPGHPEAGR